MKIKMPNGVTLECFDDDINQSRLKQGGVDVTNIRKSTTHIPTVTSDNITEEITRANRTRKSK